MKSITQKEQELWDNQPLIDSRYTLAMEFCGHHHAKYVIRFCGNWVDSCHLFNMALVRAVNHNEKRIGVL